MALDAAAIARRIAERGLKQWALASVIGVTEKTLSRWISGRIRRADRRNALSLAGALGVPLLAIEREDPDLPTTADRARTARKILDEGLLRLAGPASAWSLASDLIRSAIVPSLPDGTQARLRDLLATALWRMQRLEEARECSLRALEYAERADDRAVRARSLCTLGTIAALKGEKASARHLLEEAIARRADFEDEGDWAGAVNNLGMERKDQALLPEAIALLDQAVETFARLGRPFNRAIALNARAQAKVEAGLFQAGVADFDEALGASIEAAYGEGKASIPVLRLDALSLAGDAVAVPARFRSGRLGLSDIRGDSACMESLARLLRRSGDPTAGLRVCQFALSASTSSEPVARALLALEKSRALYCLGRTADSRRERIRANAAFRSLDLPARVCRWPVPEHGALVTAAAARAP